MRRKKSVGKSEEEPLIENISRRVRRPIELRVCAWTLWALDPDRENKPLPISTSEFYAELELLVDAVCVFDEVVNEDDDPATINENYDSAENRRHVIEELSHAIFLEESRLWSAFSEMKNAIPLYTSSIPEVGSVVGSSYCEVALELGRQVADFLRKAVPYQLEKSLKDSSEWERARQMARCVPAELRWFRENWNFPAKVYGKLVGLLAVEVQRVKPALLHDLRKQEVAMQVLIDTPMVESPKKPRKTVDTLMKELRTQNGDIVLEWTSREVADRLSCEESAVRKTPTWREAWAIDKLMLQGKAVNRAKQSNRKTEKSTVKK